MNDRCDQDHRYVIATERGISEIFHDEEEAKDHWSKNPGSSVFVAFHEVPIEQLVAHPDTVETYCSRETARVEDTINSRS